MNTFKFWTLIALMVYATSPLLAYSNEKDAYQVVKQRKKYYKYYFFSKKDMYVTFNLGTSFFDREFYFESGLSYVLNNNEDAVSLKLFTNNVFSYNNIYLLSSSAMAEYSLKLFKTRHQLSYLNLATGYGVLFPLSGGFNYRQLDKEGFVPIRFTAKSVFPLSDKLLLNVEVGGFYAKTSFFQDLKPIVLVGVIIN